MGQRHPLAAGQFYTVILVHGHIRDVIFAMEDRGFQARITI